MPLRRDAIAGAVAGLLAGLVFGWAMQAQAMMTFLAGLTGVMDPAAGLALNLAVAAALGAAFGALFRFQPDGYAATVSSGLLFGLLAWMAGPLTVLPILLGTGPTWSLEAATALFPSLVGHLLYGVLLGSLFHALSAISRRRWPLVTLPPRQEAPPTRVVILGGGFGGVSAAQALERLLARDLHLEITLVSQSNYLLFTPMLAEVASSSLEAQHISAPLRAGLRHTRFQRAEVESIDAARRVVQVRGSASGHAESLPYDHLILALGSVPTFHGLPGMQEHAFTLKSLDDSMLLRNHVIACLEHADAEADPIERTRLLTFVVAGGGFAGTEMIAELFDLTYSVLHYYPDLRPTDLRFVLVHSRERILPELSEKLAGYALRTLQQRGIEFLLGTRVAGATAEAMLLADGGQVPTRTLVWTAGNQPHPLLRSVACQHNRGGAVVVDGSLRVQGADRLWAVGDCAEVPDPDQPGSFYPPTAQHALREGKVVAANVIATLRGRPLQPFRFRTIGMLVALGRRTAAAEVMGYQFSGMLAWLMWRSVYLGKLPGLEKKVRVAIDWTLDLLFPRDIVLTATPRVRPAESRPAAAGAPTEAVAAESRPEPSGALTEAVAPASPTATAGVVPAEPRVAPSAPSNREVLP